MEIASRACDSFTDASLGVKVFVGVTAVPVVLWGASTCEEVGRMILRFGHSVVARQEETREKSRELAKGHFWSAVGTGGMSFVSVIPVIGTYKSYQALFQEATNHTTNLWLLREMDRNIASQEADGLFAELLAAEPDIDELGRMVNEKRVPTREEREKVAATLKGTLIGRNVLHTAGFHAVDGTCRLTSIAVVRTVRLAGNILANLASGRVLRLVGRAVGVVFRAVDSEAVYARDLAEQRGRVNMPESPPRLLTRDELQYIVFLASDRGKSLEAAGALAQVNHSYRNAATRNEARRMGMFVPVPERAPPDFLYKEMLLQKACEKESTADWILGNGKHSSEHLPPIYPFLEKWDTRCIRVMPADQKTRLLWGMSNRLPNLQEITLDMSQVDVRSQLLIAARFGKHSPKLHLVTFVGADRRAVEIMNRFTGWRCTVNS